MTPDELRLSILQYSFQGKLIEQRKEDGTADTLYQLLLESNESAIKEGIIKKNKKINSICEEDIIYEVPDTWKNVKLGEVSQLIDGEKRKDENHKYLEVKYLRGNIEPKYLESGKYAVKGTRVILVDGENSGEVFELPEDGYIGSTFKILYISPVVDLQYVLNFFELKRRELKANKKGAAIPHLDKDLLFNFVIPLPPLAEQKRIVERLNELFSLVDKYAVSWEKLEKINAKFPENMRKSILEYAIRGKLVEQIDAEGTSEELIKDIKKSYESMVKNGKIKKIKPFDDDPNKDAPIDIPDSWSWVYVNDIAFVTKLAGFEYTEYMSNAITKDGEVPIVRAKNVKPNKFIENTEEFISQELSMQLQRCALDEPCVLMTFIGAGIGEVAVFDNQKRNHLAPNVAKIVPHIDMNKYLMYYFLSSTGKKEIFQFIKAVGQPSLSMDTIRKVRVPLPPLAEQRRIVEKIEELLPYCERLIK